MVDTQVATFEFQTLHAQSVDYTLLFAKLNHAICLVLLLGPASVLHLAGSGETIHEIVQAPFVFHIAHNYGPTDFFNLSRIIIRRECWIFREIVVR